MKNLIFLFLSIAFSFSLHAASILIHVEIDGEQKAAKLYFNSSSNSDDVYDYLHLEKLRVRVGRVGYNIAAKSNIDDHICQLLDYDHADYRVVGSGAYDDAHAHIIRVNEVNIPQNYRNDSRGYSSDDLSLDLITCIRKR